MSFLERAWESAKHPRGRAGRFGTSSAAPTVTASHGPHLTEREARTHAQAVEAIRRWKHHHGDTLGAPAHERVRHALHEHADALGLFSTYQHDQLLGHLSTDAGLSVEDSARLASQLAGGVLHRGTP